MGALILRGLCYLEKFTLEDWVHEFKPILNKFHQIKYPKDELTFEFANRWRKKHPEERYACEKDYVSDFPEYFVWTGFEYRGRRYIVPGIRYLPRQEVSFFVTEVPWATKNILVMVDRKDTYYYNSRYDK